MCSTKRRTISWDTRASEMFVGWEVVKRKGLKQSKMINLCMNIWPKFGTNWPRGDSFEPRDINRVKVELTRRGLLKQLRYIVLWEEISQRKDASMAKQLLCQEKYQEDPIEELIDQTQRAGWTQSRERKEELDFERPQAWTPEAIRNAASQAGRSVAEVYKGTPAPVRRSARRTMV